MVTKPERDAWTLIYRLYEEYAPALRAADADAAGNLFCSALEKMQLDRITEQEQLIMMAGYNLLDEVWKASHK